MGRETNGTLKLLEVVNFSMLRNLPSYFKDKIWSENVESMHLNHINSSKFVKTCIMKRQRKHKKRGKCVETFCVIGIRFFASQVYFCHYDCFLFLTFSDLPNLKWNHVYFQG